MPAFCAYLGAGGIIGMYPGNVGHSLHLFFLNSRHFIAFFDKNCLLSGIIP